MLSNSHKSSLSLKAKAKAVPLLATVAFGGQKRRYSSYSFSTSALDGVSDQGHAQAALYPRGKNRQYPLVTSLIGPQSRSGRRG
jgi:hypothetical protein